MSGTSSILPLELIDKAIGSRIWVVMKTGQFCPLRRAGTTLTLPLFHCIAEREFTGTLLGFDDYVSE